MNIFSLAACGVIACVLIVTVRQHRPEMAVLLAVASGVLILGMILIGFAPVISSVSGMVEKTGVNGTYIMVVIKAIGISLIAQLAADICRDAGEQSIAAKVEMGGKLGIVAITMPLFGDLLQLSSNIIN